MDSIKVLSSHRNNVTTIKIDFTEFKSLYDFIEMLGRVESLSKRDNTISDYLYWEIKDSLSKIGLWMFKTTINELSQKLKISYGETTALIKIMEKFGKAKKIDFIKNKIGRGRNSIVYEVEENFQIDLNV